MLLYIDKHSPQISPLDEWTHADYAYQISHGHLPSAGAVVDPRILNEWSCHGFKIAKIPACDSGAPASEYPFKGQNYNFGHPPIYYAVTGTVARLITFATPVDDFILACRLVGILWVWAGMGVLYAGVRALGGSWRYAAMAAAMLPTVPLILMTATIVNSDAAAAFCGALSLLIIARIFVRKRNGWIIPAVATAVVAGIKEIAAIPLLAVAGVLVIVALMRWTSGERERARSLLAPAAGILGGFLAVYGGWRLLQSHRGVSDWVNPISGVSTTKISGSAIAAILSPVFEGNRLITGASLGSLYTDHRFGHVLQLVAFVFGAAGFVAMVAAPRMSPVWVVGAVFLLSIFAYPVCVELQAYISQGRYFGRVNPRYGIALIPVGLAALALVAHHRRARWIPLIGTVGAATIAVVSVVGL